VNDAVVPQPTSAEAQKNATTALLTFIKTPPEITATRAAW
jgi:hypothetical protein